MKNTTLLVACMAALSAPTALAAQQRCAHRAESVLTGVAEGALEVDAGAGSLVIAGGEDRAMFRVSATLCASDEEWLGALAVSLEGDRVETRYPNAPNSGRSYARIDLVIETPEETRVVVTDHSEDLSVTGVADVEVEDGSGGIMLARVGSAVVEDGSGGLEIVDVTGDVEVRDGSGSLEVRNVAGRVVVTDGGGSLRIENAGSVEVKDGAGNVEIHRVAGEVTVEDGAGSIEIAFVNGSVHIGEIGSGSVVVQDVEGNLVVDRGRRERIRYENVRGSVELPPARRRPGGN